MATFVEIRTETGKAVKMTGEHLLPVSPNCDGESSLTTAKNVVVGACAYGREGDLEKVVSVRSETGNGVYTVVTEDLNAKLVVGGIVAHPFSVHPVIASLTDYFYCFHRILYKFLPTTAMESSILSGFNSYASYTALLSLPSVLSLVAN